MLRRRSQHAALEFAALLLLNGLLQRHEVVQRRLDPMTITGDGNRDGSAELMALVNRRDARLEGQASHGAVALGVLLKGRENETEKVRVELLVRELRAEVDL